MTAPEHPAASDASLPPLTAESPPALLRAAHVIAPREILILTYTSDFAFFEDTCLSAARSSGACITIVHDAFASANRSLDMTRAGIDYVAAPVQVRAGGAFHPKLLVIAGEDAALVAIGSGNATGSGWHHNAEIWTVLRAAAGTAGGKADPEDSAAYPATFAELADWLERLPAHLVIDPFPEHRVQDTVALLRRHRGTAPGPQLVHNLDRPFLASLPDRSGQPTMSGQLTIASPFFDPDATALDAIALRLKPTEINLAVTTGVAARPIGLGNCIAELAADGITVTPLAIASDRYHHGKLLEYEGGEQRIALVGSANLTAAAMLRTAEQTNGNVELGLLTTPASSLAPATAGPLTKDQLQALVRELHDQEMVPATGWIAGANTDGATLSVTVAGSAAERLSGAAARRMGDDYTIPLSVVTTESPSGTNALDLLTGPAGALSGGDEIRIDLSDETMLGPVRVHDIHVVTSPIVGGSQLDRGAFNRRRRDPDFPDRLQRALQALAEVRPVPHRRTAVATDGEDPAGTAHWLARFRAAAAPKIGHALLNYALATDAASASGLVLTVPISDSGGSAATVDADIDALLADVIAAEADFDADVEPDTPTTGTDQDTEQALTPADEARIRRRLAGLVGDAGDWPPIAQCAVARTLFAAIADRMWHDESWAPVISDLLVHLGDSRPVDEDSEAEISALLPNIRAVAACGLALLATLVDADFSAATPLRQLLFETRDTTIGSVIGLATQDFGDAAFRDVIRRYAVDLPSDSRLSTDGILDTVGYLLDLNPLRALLDELNDEYGAVSASAGVIRILRPVSHPWFAVVSVLDRASRLAPIGATASGGAEEVAGAFVPPHAIIVTRTRARVRGMVYRVTVGFTGIARKTTTPAQTWSGPIPASVAALVPEGIALPLSLP